MFIDQVRIGDVCFVKPEELKFDFWHGNRVFVIHSPSRKPGYIDLESLPGEREAEIHMIVPDDLLDFGGVRRRLIYLREIGPENLDHKDKAEFSQLLGYERQYFNDARIRWRIEELYRREVSEMVGYDGNERVQLVSADGAGEAAAGDDDPEQGPTSGGGGTGGGGAGRALLRRALRKLTTYGTTK